MLKGRFCNITLWQHLCPSEIGEIILGVFVWQVYLHCPFTTVNISSTIYIMHIVFQMLYRVVEFHLAFPLSDRNSAAFKKVAKFHVVAGKVYNSLPVYVDFSFISAILNHYLHLVLVLRCTGSVHHIFVLNKINLDNKFISSSQLSFYHH